MRHRTKHKEERRRDAEKPNPFVRHERCPVPGGERHSLRPIITASPQPEKLRMTFFFNRIKQSDRLAEFGEMSIERDVYKSLGRKGLWQRQHTAHALLNPHAVPQREIPYLDDTLMRIQSHGYGLRS